MGNKKTFHMISHEIGEGRERDREGADGLETWRGKDIMVLHDHGCVQVSGSI